MNNRTTSDNQERLEGTAKGDVDRQLKARTTIVVNIVAERFGTEEVKPAPAANAPICRKQKIQPLREELMSLKRAGEFEKAGLGDLRAILRKVLLTLRRGESHRRRWGARHF